MDAAYASVLAAVPSGRISTQRLDQSVARILLLKLRTRHRRPARTPTAPRLDRVVGTPAHLAAADAITDRTTTVVQERRQALPLRAAGKQGPRHRVRRDDDRHPRRRPDGHAAPRSTRRETGAAPTDAAIADAVAAAAGQDVVVVTTMKAWDTAVTDPTGGQQKLVKALLATGKPVVVVAVRDPYDIAYFTEAPTYLATYSYSPVAIEAAARVHRRRGRARRGRCRSTSPWPATRHACSTPSATASPGDRPPATSRSPR